MDFIEMSLMDFLKHMTGAEDDHSDWVQVTVLRPEDFLRVKTMLSKNAERRREASVLKKKMAMMKAECDLEAEEWWAYVHKTYSLPKGNYTIEDNKILMQPKEKPEPAA